MGLIRNIRNRLISFDSSYNSNKGKNYIALEKSIKKDAPIIGRYPINVQIQTVSMCNGKCRFCPYQGSWNDLNQGRMSEEIYMKIIQNLKNYTIRKFCPYLENEPLIDKKLFEKIEYAYTELKPEWVEVSTNLSLLNEGKLNEIKEIFPKIPHEIWVSFHGVSKETYEDIMGLDYDRTVNNVMQLIELSQKVPLNIIIRGAGAPRIEKNNYKSWFGEKEYHRFWDERLSKYKYKPKISFFTYHDRANSEQLKKGGNSFNKIIRKDLNGFYCWRFDRWVHFLYTGEPILCCMDYERETAFGCTINDNTIEDLYSLPIFSDMIKKGIGAIKSEKDFICKRCISPGG